MAESKEEKVMVRQPIVEDDELSLGGWFEESNEDVCLDGVNSLEVRDEEKFVLKDRNDGAELQLDPVQQGSSRAELVSATLSDDSLANWRKLADHKLRSFEQKDGIIIRSLRDHLFQLYKVVAVPRPFRDKVLKLAHDHGVRHLHSN